MGISLSPSFYWSDAHFALVGVRLEHFWPSCLEGPLVYSLKRRPRGPSSLIARLATAVFHRPTRVAYSRRIPHLLCSDFIQTVRKFRTRLAVPCGLPVRMNTVSKFVRHFSHPLPMDSHASLRRAPITLQSTDEFIGCSNHARLQAGHIENRFSFCYLIDILREG